MQSDTIAASRKTTDREEILSRLREVASSLPPGILASHAPAGVKEIDAWVERADRLAQTEAQMYERIFGSGSRVIDAKADAAAFAAEAQGASPAKVRAIRTETRVLSALEFEITRLEQLSARSNVRNTAVDGGHLEGIEFFYGDIPDPSWFDDDWLD